MSAVDDMRPVRSRRWVLIEQPGPWGSSDPRDSDLEPGVADQLIDWARQSGLDLRLIRRNPRRYRPGTRTAFVVDADRHTPRMRRLSLDRVADIMSVDCAGPMAMGEPAERPLYAIGGRCGRELLRSRREHPLTSAFAAQRPDQTWRSRRRATIAAQSPWRSSPKRCSIAVWDRPRPPWWSLPMSAARSPWSGGVAGRAMPGRFR